MLRSLLFIPILALAACAAAPPPTSVFDAAEAAIEAAEKAGAEELSPVELRFARDRLELARTAFEKKKYEAVYLAIEQSEINSELAIEESRTAIQRRKMNEMLRENELLLEELQAIYGEDLK